MPSPTKASFSLPCFCSRSFSTSVTLSDGNNSLFTVSIPISFATLSATTLLSPVSITVFLMPTCLSDFIAFLEVDFITSEIKMLPANLLSTAT